jgi:hypothetical protein
MEWSDAQCIMSDCHDRLGEIDVLVNSAADAVMGDFYERSIVDID